MQSAAVINITGSGIAGTTAAFASPNDGSVVIPGDAALNASQAFTEDPNLETITGAGLGGPQVDPIPQYFTSPIPDPMLPIIAANQLTAPTASSAWPLTPGLGACTGTFPTFTCGQGDYTTAPTFPTGSNVTFNAGFGNYEFNTPFIIPLNSNITFGEGNYVFDGSPAIEAVTPPAYQTLTWTTIPSTSLTTGGSYTPSATSSSSSEVDWYYWNLSRRCQPGGGGQYEFLPRRPDPASGTGPKEQFGTPSGLVFHNSAIAGDHR